MKIYNKNNFFLGLFFCLLGIAMLIASIWKGFDIKGSLIMVLCLFFGIGILIRSLSAGYQGKPDHGFMSVLRDWDSNPQFIRRSVP